MIRDPIADLYFKMRTAATARPMLKFGVLSGRRIMAIP